MSQKPSITVFFPCYNDAGTIGVMVMRAIQVLREGRVTPVPAEQLVPGDIVHLEQGDNIPADCRLIEAFGVRERPQVRLQLSESLRIVIGQNLMQKAGTTIGDYDLIEANEAFAVQALADGRALGWDWDRVNVNGGAIALGHPIGASGARVLTTLLYAMKDRGRRTGLATLCLGGGNAVALSVEAM